MSKKEKGLRDMDNIVVIARGRGCKGLNGNGKNTINIKSKKRKRKKTYTQVST